MSLNKSLYNLVRDILVLSKEVQAYAPCEYYPSTCRQKAASNSMKFQTNRPSLGISMVLIEFAYHSASCEYQLFTLYKFH